MIRAGSTWMSSTRMPRRNQRVTASQPGMSAAGEPLCRVGGRPADGPMAEAHREGATPGALRRPLKGSHSFNKDRTKDQKTGRLEDQDLQPF